MWKKIVGWVLFAIGAINILSLVAQFLWQWMGGLSVLWPVTLFLSIAFIGWGLRIASHKGRTEAKAEIGEK